MCSVESYGTNSIQTISQGTLQSSIHVQLNTRTSLIHPNKIQWIASNLKFDLVQSLVLSKLCAVSDGGEDELTTF